MVDSASCPLLRVVRFSNAGVHGVQSERSQGETPPSRRSTGQTPSIKINMGSSIHELSTKMGGFAIEVSAYKSSHKRIRTRFMAQGRYPSHI